MFGIKTTRNFEDAKLVKTVGDKAYWRISLRVAALNDIDYGDFLETVSKNVNHQMEHLKLTGVSAQLTGGIPLGLQSPASNTPRPDVQFFNSLLDH